MTTLLGRVRQVSFVTGLLDQHQDRVCIGGSVIVIFEKRGTMLFKAYFEGEWDRICGGTALRQLCRGPRWRRRR